MFRLDQMRILIYLRNKMKRMGSFLDHWPLKYHDRHSDLGHPQIVDIEKVISNSAWKMFHDSKGRFRQYFIKRKNYIVEVPMNFYHFQTTSIELTVKGHFPTGPPETITFIGPDCPVKVDYKEVDDDEGIKFQSPFPDALSPKYCGLETEFKNDTGEAQTYNFSFQKEGRKIFEVKYQKGFSFATKTDFKLILPNGALGWSMQYEITKSTGQVFEEIITTSASSQIKVPPCSHYTARAIMEERCLYVDFKVKVKMSMPSKAADIFIKDQQGETVFFYRLKNLALLFPKNVIARDGRKLEDAVEFAVEGGVNGMQLANHLIELRETSKMQAIQGAPLT